MKRIIVSLICTVLMMTPISSYALTPAEKATGDMLERIRQHRLASQIPVITEENISIIAEGVNVDFSQVKPLRYVNDYLQMNILTVPVKPIAEALGFKVSYEPLTHTAVFEREYKYTASEDLPWLKQPGKNKIKVYLGGRKVSWNGYESAVWDFNRVRNGSTYMTLSAISDIFGVNATKNKDGTFSINQKINCWGQPAFSNSIAITVDWDHDGISDFLEDDNLMVFGSYCEASVGFYAESIPEDFETGVFVDWGKAEEDSRQY